MPEVYDYFLGNGIREVERLGQHLSKPLVWTICMMIKRCCQTSLDLCMLENRDPNYAYTVNIASKFDEHSYFITRPNLVFSFWKRGRTGRQSPLM